MKCAILDMNNGQPNEGIRGIKRTVGDFLSQDGIKGNYDVFAVRDKCEVPDIEEYDMYICSGGPGSPLKEGTAWEEKFYRLMDQIYTHNQHHTTKKYVFLICHSFQLVCIHWNMGNVCQRVSTSFGIMPIHVEEHGAQEELFAHLPNPFYAVDHRDWQVIEIDYEYADSKGFKVLAREKKRPHLKYERAVMAIRFSDEIFGTQFHPEADDEGMDRYFHNEEKKQYIIQKYGREKYTEMVEILQGHEVLEKTNKELLFGFIQNAYYQLNTQHETA